MRRLETGVPRDLGDRTASFSPDGRWLALAHLTTYTIESVQYIPLSFDWRSAGPPSTLDTDLWCCFTQLAWTPDSRQVLYTKMFDNAVSVWRQDISGGAPRPLIAAGQLGSAGVAFSARRNRLAYSDYRSRSRIWRLDLSTRGATPEPFLSSEGYERSPDISLDGTQVAFTSSRAGGGTIWICDASGANERRLTHLRGGAPSWSPDGHQIAFDAVVDGNEDIYVATVPDGQTRRLTSNVGKAVLPTWSADGDWIYFTSTIKEQGAVIWKTRASAPDQPVKVTNGWVAREAPDRSALYVAKFDSPSVATLWKKPLPDGPETLLLDDLVNIRNFAVINDGIYYEAMRDAHSFAIMFYRFASGRSELITEIGKTPFEGMDFAPGGWLLFSTIEEHPGDLWLVENFR
jgi:dipeptidyl aminopeptidase/acylaminoacyl peptidase